MAIRVNLKHDQDYSAVLFTIVPAHMPKLSYNIISAKLVVKYSDPEKTIEADKVYIYCKDHDLYRSSGEKVLQNTTSLFRLHMKPNQGNRVVIKTTPAENEKMPDKPIVILHLNL